MAVTLTVIQAAADRRLGNGVAAPAEPINGILTRYLAAATALVEDYAVAAPEEIQNTAASMLVGYMYDAPVSQGARFANALANSGAQLLLSRWQSQRVAIIGDNMSDMGGVSGLTRVGSESVDVAMIEEWVFTTISVPTAPVIGVEVIFPNGSTTGIELFPNSLGADAPVTLGDSATPVSQYAIGRTAQNTIALASSVTGQHTLTIWTVG